VPRQDSTGGKQKLGPISKQGDRYLRRILVVGAELEAAARAIGLQIQILNAMLNALFVFPRRMQRNPTP
jgi:transposase